MFKYSLKTKLVLFIAMLMIITLMTGSLIVINQERDLIIMRYKEVSKAIIKSLAPSFTDALMYEEMGIFPIEGFIEDFADQIQTQKVLPVKFTIILSNEFAPVTLRDPSGLGRNYYDYLLNQAVDNNQTQSIFLHPKYGWVLETIEFLEISGKRWGYLIVGFDAEDIRATIRNLFIYMILVSGIIILLTLVSVYFITGHLTKNLNAIVTIMDNIDINTEKVISVPQSNDEIGFLAQHFREMQSRLLSSRNKLKDAQKEIYHAEKLASIGRLASGVAHEINNPLMGLKNCADSISSEPDNINQTVTYIKLMSEGLEKIESIVRKLLDFAHKKSQELQEVDIKKTIAKVNQLINYRLEKSHIKIDTVFSEDLHLIFADPNLLEEVIMNILINAIDAMPRGGKVSISAQNVDNKNVEIKISDSGIGISKANLDKIFDPFFTTKSIGKGTGLGLSVSLMIIEELGGKILVESKLDKGTLFAINIPVRSLKIKKKLQ